MTRTEKENVQMTADTMAGDLLQAALQEVQLAPDIWPRISEAEQNEIIDRLRKRVHANVREATRLIAAEGRTSIQGELKKVSFGDKTVATLEFGKLEPKTEELCHAQGMTILLVIADLNGPMGDDVQADPDQPPLPGLDGDGPTAQIIEQASRRAKRKRGPF